MIRWQLPAVLIVSLCLTACTNAEDLPLPKPTFSVASPSVAEAPSPTSRPTPQGYSICPGWYYQNMKFAHMIVCVEKRKTKLTVQIHGKTSFEKLHQHRVKLEAWFEPVEGRLKWEKKGPPGYLSCMLNQIYVSCQVDVKLSPGNYTLVMRASAREHPPSIVRLPVTIR